MAAVIATGRAAQAAVFAAGEGKSQEEGALPSLLGQLSQLEAGVDWSIEILLDVFSALEQAVLLLPSLTGR